MIAEEEDGQLAEKLIKKISGKNHPTEVLRTQRAIALRDYAQELGLGISLTQVDLLAQRAVSLFQGDKKSGTLFENSVLDDLDERIAPLKFTRQWRAPGYKGKKIDGYLRLPQIDWYLSMKVSTRERAENTWNEEYRQSAAWSKGREFRFLALTLDEIGPSLKGKLNRKIETVTVGKEHFNQIRSIITDIRESVEAAE